MKVCNYCGSRNEDRITACEHCGASDFSNVCENCGEVFDTPYCPNCGVKAGNKGLVCPRCGKHFFTAYCPSLSFSWIKSNSLIYESMKNILELNFHFYVINGIF